MMALTRRPGWELYLDDLLTRRMHARFVWGQHDCALFAADCVAAITGVDLAADMRGYCTPMGAHRLLERRGGLFGVATAALGAPCEVDDVAQGDVVLLPNAGRDLLAVVLLPPLGGLGRALAPGAAGLVQLPLSLARSAWKVG